MKRYVLLLLFTKDFKKVLLIKGIKSHMLIYIMVSEGKLKIMKRLLRLQFVNVKKKLTYRFPNQNCW